MRSVGIRMLKSRLSEYVKIAAGGEVVLVTDRDQVVAELRPPAPGRSEAVADAMLAEAVRKGWLRPRLTTPGVPPPRGPVAAWSDIEAELESDRGDR
jgi:antitoxin (DNA-binding transcriptional repressor) of toxin-antitoxin stability system